MKHRYQVILKESFVNRVKALTGEPTTTEIVNEAMLLFEWAIEKTAEGCEIGAIEKDTDSYSTVVLPMLRAISRKGKEPA